MTVLGETPYYLVEYDQWAGHRMLSIIDKFTGQCKVFSGLRVAGEFRDCLTTHPVERVIETYLRMAAREPWHPAYKPMRLACPELF